MNRRTKLTTIIAAALVALCLPALAAAQGTWGRDRDYRRDRRDDNYYGRYDRRSVRESARRLSNYAADLQRDLDHELDHSREDGTRHEDRLNFVARNFRNAANDLRNSIGDGRNLNQSADEARRVLDIGRRIGRRIQHHFGNDRLRSDWYRVSQELRIIADAYGSNRGYGNGGYNGRDDDDRYRRRDDRRSSNDEWRRRLPF